MRFLADANPTQIKPSNAIVSSPPSYYAAVNESIKWAQQALTLARYFVHRSVQELYNAQEQRNNASRRSDKRLVRITRNQSNLDEAAGNWLPYPRWVFPMDQGYYLVSNYDPRVEGNTPAAEVIYGLYEDGTWWNLMHTKNSSNHVWMLMATQMST